MVFSLQTVFPCGGVTYLCSPLAATRSTTEVVASQPVKQAAQEMQKDAGKTDETTSSKKSSVHWLGSLWDQSGLANVTEVVQQKVCNPRL